MDIQLNKANGETVKINKKSKSSKKAPNKTGSAGTKKALKITGFVLAGLWLLMAFLLLLIPFNVKAVSFWLTIVLALVFLVFFGLLGDYSSGNRVSKPTAVMSGGLGVLVLAFLVIIISGTQIFHAAKYAGILPVSDSEFTEDLPEAAGTDSIALMDTKSAKKLGDREIGSLANVVSQYNVAEEYTQIDYKGKPVKVAELEYEGFFKWMNNKDSGVPGYVTVDPVTMSGDYRALQDNMFYVPSAYWGQDAKRHIYFAYPTTMFGNLHFEIDEDGKPYYVASVYDKTISLFGGEKVTGALIMDPVSGEVIKYDLGDVPRWTDVVVDGDTICRQYNWYGKLSNGFMNSLFGKKGCKQVTEYRGDEEEDDEVPVSDYGYVAKDGDIWIYTGVTSVNSDSSNIGFLMANERTGEARFYTVSGADENSAMCAAEGEVQEKRYQASFPSLINVDGYPTYIMVLKDSSGLVKLYAAVNVEQYNLVTTAGTQKDCISKYRKMMGIAEAPESDGNLVQEELLEAEAEKEITIKDIKYIDIDGNTYIYLVTEDGELFKAKAASHEEMLLLEAGQKIKIAYAGKTIVSIQLVYD